MTDAVDPGDDDGRLLLARQGLIRETGLDPYLDIRVPGRASRAGGAVLVLNRAERVLEELDDLDESVTEAGEWNAVVFKSDPDLPELYSEAADLAAAAFAGHLKMRDASLIDRERRGDRRNALRRAILSIGQLRRAFRNQV